jgi:PAS domain S-box-containing protein
VTDPDATSFERPVAAGEMAARIWAFDWAATPLGPVTGWSAGLRIAVQLALGLGFPAAILVGSARRMIHNDAWARRFRSRIPDALGRDFLDVFGESADWPGPVVERVLAGRTVLLQEQCCPGLGDPAGDAWFDLSASPLHDAAGANIGALIVLTEVTDRVRSVNALRQRETELARIQRMGGICSIEVDVTGMDARSGMSGLRSPEYRVLHGLPPGLKVESHTEWRRRIHPDDRDRAERALFDALAGGRAAYESEYRIIRPSDGQMRWILARADVQRDKWGRPLRLAGIHADITARRLAEEALHESEHRLAALAEATAEAIFCMSPDWTELRQLRGGGFLADCIQPRGNWIQDYIPFEDRPRFLARIGEVTWTKGRFEFEHRVRRADGSIGWAVSRAVPLLNAAGGIREWFGAATDITARKEAELALARSEERFRRFGEATSDVLWIRDAGTLRWEYLTPAFEAVFGVGRDDAVRWEDLHDWVELILPEDRTLALEMMEEVRGGEPVTFEYRIRRPADGGIRWLRSSDFPMRDDAGQVRRIGGITKDVTEEKRFAERQAVLVAELQHRSRNLLALVRSLASKTLRSGAPLETFEDRLGALSRAQGLLSRFGRDTVELGTLVRTELEVHAEVAPPRVIVGGPVVHLTAQQVQTLSLALHELATNAVKYGALRGEAGQLAVCWHLTEEQSGRGLVLEWTETAAGLCLKAVTRRGYGRELIEEALPYSLGARTTYDLTPDGVRCRIEMPVPEAGATGGRVR